WRECAHRCRVCVSVRRDGSAPGLDEAVGEGRGLLADRRAGIPHGLVEDLQDMTLGIEGLAVGRLARDTAGTGDELGVDQRRDADAHRPGAAHALCARSSGASRYSVML